MSIEKLLQEGHALHQQGKYPQAVIFYKKALKKDPNHEDALALLGSVYYETQQYPRAADQFLKLYNLNPERTDILNYLAAALQLSNQLEQALMMYQNLVDLYPDQPEQYYNLGSVYKALEKWPEAINAFQKALELQPNYAKAHNNLAGSFLGAGNAVQAETHYLEALSLQPDYVLARFNLAFFYLSQGRLLNAREALKDYLRLNPNHAEAHYKLGTTFQKLGELQASIGAFQKALDLEPRMAEAHRSMGMSHQTLGDFEASLTCFEKALELRPDYTEALVNLSNSYREMGHNLKAYNLLENAPESDALALKKATFVPTQYDSLEDLAHWRNKLQADLEPLKKKALLIEDPMTDIGQTNFYLAYQGGNDRPIQEDIAQIYRPMLPKEQLSPKSDERLRVGFVSAFFSNHTITHYYKHHILAFQDNPEVLTHLLLAPGTAEDHVTQELSEACSQTLRLPRNLDLARQQVSELGLDLLVYTDIGLEPFTYFLSQTRLARKQAVLPGHPVTTGIDTLDYFVSNQGYELPDAQTHYSEQLITLDSVPVWYKTPEIPTDVLSKSDLGVQEKTPIMVCPQTLFKVHPDMDAGLQAVLDKTDAEIFFFQFKKTLLHRQLQGRFQKTLGKAAERVHFLPWADKTTFFSWLSAADVILDTPHFGGGSTHYLAFGAHKPVLTWNNPYLRGRSAQGMYHTMRIPPLEASTPEEFGALAQQTLAEGGKWQEEIARAKHRLFEQSAGPEAFAQWVYSLF